MRSSRLLARDPDLCVREAVCRAHHKHWSLTESTSLPEFVLVRSGRFRYASRAGTMLAGPDLGYLALPGEPQRFAHPAGGDVCTSVTISPRLWQELTDGDATSGPVPVDGRLHLAHRLLLRAAAGGDTGYATTERLLHLLAEVGTRGAHPWPADQPRPSRRDTVMVDAAREAILAGDPAAAGLVPLARSLGVSPYRLSRVFGRLVGVPVTRYRNQVRVRQALDRIEQGEPDLGRLAADLGFADQAHLTRTVRAHVGHTPSQVRRLLGRAPGRRAGGRTSAPLPGSPGQE